MSSRIISSSATRRATSASSAPKRRTQMPPAPLSVSASSVEENVEIARRMRFLYSLGNYGMVFLSLRMWYNNEVRICFVKGT